jgi:hypothetical protein
MCGRFQWESPKERDRSENSDIDGRILSEWILGEIRSGGEGCRVNSVGSGQGPMMASCKYSHEPSGFGSTVTE